MKYILFNAHVLNCGRKAACTPSNTGFVYTNLEIANAEYSFCIKFLS